MFEILYLSDCPAASLEKPKLVTFDICKQKGIFEIKNFNFPTLRDINMHLRPKCKKALKFKDFFQNSVSHLSSVGIWLILYTFSTTHSISQLWYFKNRICYTKAGITIRNVTKKENLVVGNFLGYFVTRCKLTSLNMNKGK